MNQLLTSISRNRAVVPFAFLLAFGLTFIPTLFSVPFLPSVQPDNEIWELFGQFNLSFPKLSAWINFAVVSICGWGVFKLNEYFSMGRFRSNFPLIFLLLFYIGNPSLHFLSEGTFAMLFALISIFILFASYQQSKVSEYGFMVGITLGTLGLIWTKGLLYTPVFLIGFWMMRSFTARSVIALFLGIASIFWLQFAVNYYQGETDRFIAQFKDIFTFTVPDFRELPIILQINILITFLTGLVSGSKLLISNLQEKVRTQVCYNFVILLSMAATVLTFFDSLHMAAHLTLMYLTIALLAANIFSMYATKGTAFLFVLLMALYGASFAMIVWKI